MLVSMVAKNSKVFLKVTSSNNNNNIISIAQDNQFFIIPFDDIKTAQLTLSDALLKQTKNGSLLHKSPNLELHSP